MRSRAEHRRIRCCFLSQHGDAITAVEYALGSISILVGDAQGNLSAWFRVRLKEEDEDLALVRDGRPTELDDEDLTHVVYSEFSMS